jgi:hypothetical protein
MVKDEATSRTRRAVDMNQAFPIKQLSDLQDVDREILSRQKIVSDVRAKLADNSAVQSASLTVQGLEEQLSAQSSIRRRAESEIQQINSRIQSVETRLYGGSVTNPRELSAFQNEKAIFERQLAEEEEKLLDAMVQIEDLQTSLGTARTRLSELNTLREQNAAEWTSVEKRLSGEIDELNKARAEIASGISAAALSTYQNLLRARNGQAVARVERGICQGCRITLPNSTLQRARSATGPVTCTSCRRLLYVV